MCIRGILLFAIVAAAAVFQAPSAFAQATRTWVSGVGDDVNPCSRTAPCKTFAGAISKTAAGGEINTLDPGGFGAVTITKSISIVSVHNAGVLLAAGNGVTVNAPAGSEVLLEGLDIEGLANTASPAGVNGVRMIGSGRLTIRKCAIRNFSDNAVFASGLDGARVVIDESFLTGSADGVRVAAAAGTNQVAVSRSLIEGNIRGVTAVGDGNEVTLADNILRNGTDLVVKSGATAVSFGGNVIASGAPTQTVARK
ncbi:right-handed parallel beta-helix repeat-containing protein [Methylopila sp. 73B]|uniref:right-handed parallel beta-helix repeat-containing protein n=1 Tax=Methylopila sp. 73B TaxID=1120792 RepID=UPI00035DDACA|nr:right-handed parallel beta-helix repeat-containing protein [Methylopila sp. 73B]